MPQLQRSPNARELEQLRKLFLKAETDIINEIGRLRSLGLTDYSAVASLERVQAILQTLQDDCWDYMPRMIEKQFYVRVPEARKILEPVEKHLLGYRNAMSLTAEQTNIVQRLTMNLMGQLSEAAATVTQGLESALLGRAKPDIFRQTSLQTVAAMEAAGRGAKRAVPELVNALYKEGVTAFVDKAGRKWSLHSYGNMVCRTTARQAEVLATLTADSEQDLYKISSHGTTCKLCAPFEGRVYSKSGKDPDFPPLAMAFGKVDPNGPDELSNTWLNIHPNCLHAILPWTSAGRTPEELQAIKDFSDPEKNPFTRDPRTQKQVESYRKKERAREKWLADYRQFERYKMTLGDKVPKSFETFQKHKIAGDESYNRWVSQYREANFLEKYSQVRYHDDGTVVVTDMWKKHRTIPNEYRPNAVVETQFPKKQTDRSFYDKEGLLYRQVHSGAHGLPKLHGFGQHGEHAHDFIRNENGDIQGRKTRELTSDERKENGDIL